MGHQWVRSSEWERRFNVSLEAALLTGEEHQLPARAEVFELGPYGDVIGIVMLKTLSKYILDVTDQAGQRYGGKPVVFIERMNGNWMPAVITNEGRPAETFLGMLGSTWRESRRAKREKKDSSGDSD